MWILYIYMCMYVIRMIRLWTYHTCLYDFVVDTQNHRWDIAIELVRAANDHVEASWLPVVDFDAWTNINMRSYFSLSLLDILVIHYVIEPFYKIRENTGLFRTTESWALTCYGDYIIGHWYWERMPIYAQAFRSHIARRSELLKKNRRSLQLMNSPRYLAKLKIY